MPKYTPGFVDSSASRYGKGFSDSSNASQPSLEGPSESQGFGRGRGARKFAHQEPGQPFGNSFESARNNDGARQEDIISLENIFLGKFIGKQGAAIKQLQSDTGCKIDVLKDTANEMTTDVRLLGAPDQINAVKLHVEERFGISLGADKKAPSTNNNFQSFGQDNQNNGFLAPSFGGNQGFGQPTFSNFQTATWDAESDKKRGGFGFGNWNDQKPVETSNAFSSPPNSNGFKSGFQNPTARGFGVSNSFEVSNFPSNGSNSNSFANSNFGNSDSFASGQTNSFQFGSENREPQSFSSHRSQNNSFGSGRGNFQSRSDQPTNAFGVNSAANGFVGQRARQDEDFSVFSAKGSSAFGQEKGSSSRFDWGPKGPPTAEVFEGLIKTNDASSVPKIDWDAVRSCKPEARFKDYPAITKNFYHENPLVASRTEEEVGRIRESKNSIIVKDMSKSGNRPCPNPVLTFEEAFDPYPEILDTIYNQGFESPSPIQCQGWPVLLKGHDLIGIAQTGSGKTLAFLLPALIHIDLQPVPREKRGGPNVLVLCPTRELALQIESEVKKYFYRNIKSVCVYGGGDRAKQVSICTDGVEIVIATPGRLYDLISNDIISIMSVTFVVLDEADRMLDLGFEPQILKCMLDVRPDRQTVMTSATWNWDVQRIAAKYLTDPFFVNVGSLDLTAVHSVTQNIVFAEDDDKEALLFRMVNAMQGDDKMIVFIGKKLIVDQIASKMALAGMSAESIHGGREQYAREEAIDSFRENQVRVLLATDVASRGLDIVDVTHVVNFDFPKNMEEYVHRVGRTGRAGRTGVAISFLSRRDWGNSRELIRILEEANQEVPDELRNMADRFDRMKERRAAEGGYGGRGGFRGGRGGGGRRNRDDDLFSFSGSTSAFVPG